MTLLTAPVSPVSKDIRWVARRQGLERSSAKAIIVEEEDRRFSRGGRYTFLIRVPPQTV